MQKLQKCHKLLEYEMKIIERILKKRPMKMTLLDEMQIAFATGKGLVHAIFLVQQMKAAFFLCKTCGCW